MKKQKLPEITIKGVKYEVLILKKNIAYSICDKCDLGLERCTSLYRDLEECPCFTLGREGFKGRSYLRAKKAGQ